MKHGLQLTIADNVLCDDAVYLGASDYFAQGCVTAPSPEINRVMWNIAESLVNSHEDLTDEICASGALGLAGIKIRAPEKFDADGFAPGIKRDTRLPVYIPGIGDIKVTDFTSENNPFVVLTKKRQKNIKRCSNHCKYKTTVGVLVRG